MPMVQAPYSWQFLKLISKETLNTPIKVTGYPLLKGCPVQSAAGGNQRTSLEGNYGRGSVLFAGHYHLLCKESGEGLRAPGSGQIASHTICGYSQGFSFILKDGDRIIVDGDEGKIYFQPDQP